MSTSRKPHPGSPNTFHEMTIFPKGKYDDQVNSTAQFLDWFKKPFPSQDISEFYRQLAKEAQERRRPRPVRDVGPGLPGMASCDEQIVLNRSIRLLRPNRAACCEADLNGAGEHGFESRSLQQTVRLSRDFSFLCRKAGCCRGRARPGRRHGRQRRAGSINITPTAGNISVGPYSSTAVPPARFGDSDDTGPQQAGCLGTCRCRLGVEPDRAQAKPSTVRCSCQQSGRRECASSLSAVRSSG